MELGNAFSRGFGFEAGGDGWSWLGELLLGGEPDLGIAAGGLPFVLPDFLGALGDGGVRERIDFHRKERRWRRRRRKLRCRRPAGDGPSDGPAVPEWAGKRPAVGPALEMSKCGRPDEPAHRGRKRFGAAVEGGGNIYWLSGLIITHR